MASSDAHAIRRSLVVATLLVAVSLFLVAFLVACREKRSTPPVPDAAPRSSSRVSLGAATVAPTAVAPIAAAASARPPSSAEIVAPLPEKDWVWKMYSGDHFTVLLPGEPKITALPEEVDKVGYTEAHVDVPGGQVSFAAGFSDFPQSEVDNPEAFLDEHARPPRRGFTDVLHKRVATLPGGHPGRVLILRRDISGTPLRVYSRIYLVGRRLYSLIVSTLDVGGVSETVVKKFMDSFKLS